MKTADFAATVPWTGIIGKPDFEPGYLFWDGLKFISMDEIQWPTIGGLEDRILHTRSLADENLFELIKAEEAFRDLVVGTLTDSLEVEILKRIETDAGLTASISVLTDVVDDPETGLAATYATLVLVQDAVDDPTTGLAATAALVASIQEAVNDPVTGLSAAWTTITAIQTQIDDPTDGLAALSASIVSVEEAIYDPLTGLEARLNTEIAARESGDDAVAAQIDTEIAASIDAGGLVKAYVDTELTASAASILGETDTRYAHISIEAIVAAHTDDITSLGAEYVLTVETSGGGVPRVAGFRVTNVGGPSGASDFVIQADKFGFVNTSGLGSVQPFIIDGGVVYITEAVIKELTIGTAKLAYNAATLPVTAWTEGITTGSSLQSLSITTSGAQVMIDFGVASYLTSGTPPISCNFIVKRNGSTILDIPRVVLYDPLILTSFTFFDTPAAGSYTYDLEANMGGGTWEHSHRSMRAIEYKR